MRRLRVRLRSRAAADLTKIGQYVVDRGSHPSVARSYVGRIRTACERVGDAPLGGRLRADVWRGIRSLAFERRAVILYRVVKGEVEVLRILHRGRQVVLHDRASAEEEGGQP